MNKLIIGFCLLFSLPTFAFSVDKQDILNKQLNLLHLKSNDHALMYIFTETNASYTLKDIFKNTSAIAYDAPRNIKQASIGWSQIAIQTGNKKTFVTSLYQGSAALKILKMKPGNYQLISETSTTDNHQFYKKDAFVASTNLNLKAGKNYYYKLVFTSKTENLFFKQINQEEAKQLLSNTAGTIGNFNALIHCKTDLCYQIPDSIVVNVQ